MVALLSTYILRLKNWAITAMAASILVLLSIPGFAQTKTWTGNIDSDWHKTGNWSPTGVPTSTNNVLIIPNDGNPFPVISNGDATVANLKIGDYRTGELTVSNNRTLTITNGLRIDQGGSGGTLFIESGGAVNLTGGTFTMTFSNAAIEIDNGSFTSAVNVKINGDGLLGGENVDLNFNAGFDMQDGKAFSVLSGSVTVTNDADIRGPFSLGSSTFEVGGALEVVSGHTFNTEQANVTIQGETTINGTYNGDDGITNFNGKTIVASGGVINLDKGDIYFNEDTEIRNNGTANFGSGTVEFQGMVTVESSGFLNVQDATVNITGDADFNSNGNLTIDDGSINVLGNASLSSGGSFDLNNGSFNVGGDASFTNGGTVNAGNSEIDLEGDLTIAGGGTFNSGTSTVTFSGDSTQTIYTSGSDITFHNVIVKSGSSVQTDGSGKNTITVENDLTVEEGAQVDVQDDDTIDIQGNIDSQGEIESEEPFVVSISTPSLTSVVITFNKAMDEGTAETESNYTINNGISVNNATLNASDASKVTLTVSTLTRGGKYEVTLNNVESEDGGEISENHKKRFTVAVDVIYYSRTSGDWNTASSWSIQSHTGTAANSTPNAQNGDKVQIGNSHTISITTEEDISMMDEVIIENTGVLEVNNRGTLILNDFVINGNGTFSVANGGTLDIGSPDGITAEGTSTGNIQTTQRNYSTQANYIYSGSNAQHTGNGLPQQVNDLYINNSSDVTASSNIRTDGTLYLQDGSLIIPSGQALIANTKSIGSGNLIFKRILSGSPGWRMISSPIDATYDNFLSGILTQGYDGALYDASVAPFDTLQPNVLYYAETYEGTDNQRWRAPTAASASVIAGTGYQTYLFGDVASDNRYNDPLPDTLVVEGQEFEGTGNEFDFNVTFTAAADSGWNLVGNPFGAAIDWEDTENWTRTNIDNTIYVWDPEDKEYKTWNSATQTGSLNNGLIPPFQAFWIKANAENPILKANEAAKTFGGTFVGATESPLLNRQPKLEILLANKDRSSRIFFSFTENALVGKDPSDAYLLQPPPGVNEYIQLFSIGENSNRYVINTLPRNFGVPIEIPISAGVYQNNRKMNGEVNLSFSAVENIPSSWKISIVDRISGKTVTALSGNAIAFKTDDSGQPAQQEADQNVLSQDYKILAKADPDEARFLLRINPGAEADGLPKSVELKQNFPNPLTDNTRIQFTLPIQDRVTIEVYDITGRLVDTIARDKIYQAGLNPIDWNPPNLSSGTYIYVLKTDEHYISKKMTIIK